MRASSLSRFLLVATLASVGCASHGPKSRLPAPEAPTVPMLDSLVTRFWHAAQAQDTATLSRLTTDPQPGGAAQFFIRGLRLPVRYPVEPDRAPEEPRLRVVADTAWLRYDHHTEHVYTNWRHHTFRFERRCGTWRIALLTLTRPLPPPSQLTWR
jgi:hypothetical protein